MRILQVAARMASLAGFALPLMQRLRDAGHEVEALGQFDGFERRVRDAGFQVHDWRAGHTFHPLAIRRARRELAAFLEGNAYDAIHTHVSFAGIIGNPVAYSRTRCLIYTQHGFYVHPGMNPLLRRVWLAVERIGLRSAHHVICVSAAEKRLAETLGVGPPGKFHLVPGVGIDLERFQLAPQDRQRRRAAVRQSLGLGAEETVLLTVSRLTWDKGYGELIEAVRRLQAARHRFRLLAAGSGKDERGIRAMVERAGVREAFLLLGWRDDVPDLYCAADLFVFASHREGLPVAPLEALASGLPVVASDLPGCREEIAHGQDGLLYPVGDVGALTAALGRLLTAPEEAARLAAAGPSRAAAFSLEAALSRQLELYTRIAREP